MTIPAAAADSAVAAVAARAAAAAAPIRPAAARSRLKRAPNGQQVVVVGSDNKTVFVSGTRMPGANWKTQAPRPWVDKLDFETGAALARLREPGRRV